MQILCYEKCGTCKKALKWLKDNGITVPVRPIKEENPSKEELREWQKRSGLPLNKFFNTSGKLYREYELSKKLPQMSFALSVRATSRVFPALSALLPMNSHMMSSRITVTWGIIRSLLSRKASALAK